MKIGLKLNSTEVSLIRDVKSLKKKGYYDYVELYVIPGTYKKTISLWKEFKIPFVIHAPHSFHEVNFAQAGKWQSNQRNFIEAQKFADSLSSGIIIVHGGNNGPFDEALRQFTLLDESRIALENKPKIGLYDEECVGFSPQEIQKAFDSGVIKQTVLDFGHAVCAANSLQVKYIDLVKELAGFNPVVFHLSDGDAFSEKDTHFKLGKGNLNIKEFLSFIHKESLLTIEAPRDSERCFEDYAEDILYLRNFSNVK